MPVKTASAHANEQQHVITSLRLRKLCWALGKERPERINCQTRVRAQGVSPAYYSIHLSLPLFSIPPAIFRRRREESVFFYLPHEKRTMSGTVSADMLWMLTRSNVCAPASTITPHNRARTRDRCFLSAVPWSVPHAGLLDEQRAACAVGLKPQPAKHAARQLHNSDRRPPALLPDALYCFLTL